MGCSGLGSNLFKGGYIGDISGESYLEVINGDTRSLDYSSLAVLESREFVKKPHGILGRAL